ncbi:type IV pilus modification PilV family protein [Demequina soli]|uniref:type IV pilus modification PilV family protein n=1 Tax=Demequina soli TaxID=1638987 RepID=UPI001471FA94|nr:prepilin-type N-terminal cleavage/methylation domain-containing protein [Demequina soli]
MSKRDNDRGFSLTEVMVAMVILLIVMTAMISALILALTKTSAAATRATAAEAVQARIEDARSNAASGSCTVMQGVVTKTTVVYDGRKVPITIKGAVAQPNGDSCKVAAAGDDGDPAQILRVTVTATTTVAGLNNPLAQTTTDLFMKYEAP